MPSRKRRPPLPDADRPQGSPFVATFYSFKGGVGRTLLLANVGWVLSERRPVLLWDLDVEAPGLHRIPALRPNEVRSGFFEWLTKWDGERSLSPGRKKALAALVRPVPGRPQLHILPAFGDGADFVDLYASIPWQRLFVEEPDLGLDLFRAVVASLGASFEVILIDSRTGITDIGGLLTAVLPHATVLVGSYGHQSVAGLYHVATSLGRAVAGRLAPRAPLGAGAKLSLLHVVSPVPADAPQAAERKRVWSDLFKAVDPIVVPFDQRLLWQEELLAAADPSSPPARAYREVAERLEAERRRLLAAAEGRNAAEARYPDLDAEPLPGDMARPGLRFQERTALLLKLLGYEVEPKRLRGGNEVDLVARFRQGLEEQAYWVECKDHRAPVGKETLEKLDRWIADDAGRAMRARGMVVARSFSPEAVSYARDHASIRVFTVEELEDRLFDARPYLQSIVTAFEGSALARTYVRQRVLLEGRPAGEAEVDLLDHALAWVGGTGPPLWLLLGDYGTGKSAFYLRLTAELARRALADPRAPIPIAVQLRDHANVSTLDGLLFAQLRDFFPDGKVPVAAIRYLVAVGRAVLVFDSFDEMGVAAAGQGVERQLRELALGVASEAVTPAGNRVLITCRSHFFRDQQQVKDAAGGTVAGIPAAADSALGRLARLFDVGIDELLLFDDAQIAEFLGHHLAQPEVERAQRFIAETYDLGRLAPRPVLLEMIVASLPKLFAESRGAVSPADLYEVYTRQWLEDRSGRTLQTPPLLRHRLLTWLAARIWDLEGRRIHHRDLLARLKEQQAWFSGLDYERVDLELRTAAFLVRTAEGYYHFSHKSFLEYFLARALACAVAEGKLGAALDTGPLSPEVTDFFWRMPGLDAEGAGAQLSSRLRDAYAWKTSENALRLVAGRRRANLPALKVEGARLDGAELSGEDLREVQLPKAFLAGARLGRANLEGAVLEKAGLAGACLEQAVLAGTRLDGADLANANLTRVDLSVASLKGAGLDHASLVDAILDGADLTGASLVQADLTAVSGGGTRLEGADFAACSLWLSAWRPESRLASLAGSNARGLSAALGLSACGPQPAPFPLTTRRLVAEARLAPCGHLDSVSSVAYAPDGRTLASAGKDGTVRIWDATSGEARAVLRGHEDEVMSVAYAPDGRTLTSAGADGTVRLWDAASGEARAILRGYRGRSRSVAYAPDGRTLASAGDDASVRLWDVASGEARAVLRGHEGWVWSVTYAPDGRTLASAGEGGNVCLWDAASGEARAVLRGHEGRVMSVAYAPDSRTLASAGEGGNVRLWDAASGEARVVFRGHERAVGSVAYAPDGRTLASTGDDGSVRLRDAASGEARAILRGHAGRVRSFAYAPDGRILASAGDDGSVRFWDAASGEARAVLGGHEDWARSVAYAPDGRTLASAGDGGTVRLWDAASGEARTVLRGHRRGVGSVGYAPDGRTLASTGDDGTVRLWDAASGEARTVLRGHEGRVSSVGYAPDGRTLASTGDDGTVRLWDAASGEARAVLRGHAGRVWSLAYAPDGRTLASAGEDGTVRLSDAASGEVRAVLRGHRRGVRSVAYPPDGRTLASAGNDGTVRLWDAASGEARAALSEHEGGVMSVAYAPDGRSVASAGYDGSVRLWDAVTGRWLGSLVAAGKAGGLAVSPQGWLHASGDLDRRSLRLGLSAETEAGGAVHRTTWLLPLAPLLPLLESPARVEEALSGKAVEPGPPAPPLQGWSITPRP